MRLDNEHGTPPAVRRIILKTLTTMVEYYNNRLAVPTRMLIDEGIMTVENYKQLSSRNKIKVVQRGCLNTPALVDYNSLPERFRKVIEMKFGDVTKQPVANIFTDHIIQDTAAIEFLSSYQLPNGDSLPADAVTEYYNNAIVLNAIHDVLNSRIAMRKALGGKTTGLWENITRTVLNLDQTKYPHTLPANERRLREKYNLYLSNKYQSLIHKNYCNNNARKVDDDLERLILSIYCMTNKPYSTWVQEDYLLFIAGVKDIVDMETGEFFNREDFKNEKDDSYISVSAATCWNYINNPKNRVIVDRLRATSHNFLSKVRPHMHRHAPMYALSKISLDDRDLPRKLASGDRVKAYYAYDVASGCLIGASYSLKKDIPLFIDCIREMFRFIDSRSWGMPLEMEVEHHLVNNFKDDLFKAGVVFPFVRWCAPSNSQEKHAEQLNRQKKYGYEKRYQDGIGRWYLKDEANVTGGERVYDDATNKYIVKERSYSYDQLVADDLKSIVDYNNGLHRDQKLYKGLTRMQVMEQNINPNLADINRPLLVRYIGNCTTTSIQRNMYCQVQYNDYMLPTPEILSKLAPNNYTVQAYYMPMNAQGEQKIDSLYLYQNDDYICEAKQIAKFNTSLAERTQVDIDAFTEQAKYIAKFDKMVKDGKNKLAKVVLYENTERLEEIEVEVAAMVIEEPKQEIIPETYDENYQAALALNSL